MTPIPPAILTTLRKNVDTLRRCDPALAAQVDEAAWPEDLKFLPALDGTPTAFSKSFGRSGWFAWSGAPRVREETVCEHFEAGGSNVILPSAGQGVGLKILLNRFDACQSIFVWESSPVRLAVLLALSDFSTAIAESRLIFIVHPDLKKGLVDYLVAHLELAVPDKMMSWPWISENDMRELSRQVEQAVGEISNAAAEEAAALQERLDRMAAKDARAIRSLRIFALDPRPIYHELARDIQQAAQGLDLKADLFLLDRPIRGSGIAILRHLLAESSDAVISCGIEQGRWGVRVPLGLPVISVLAPPGVALGPEAVKDLAPGDNERFAFGSEDDLAELRPRVPADKLCAVELAVNPEAFAPTAAASDTHVAILADRPDPDPETVGIRQQSHKLLWRHVQEYIEQHPLSFTNESTGDVLRRAGNETGIAIADAELLKSFTQLIAAVLAPAAVATAVAEAVLCSGYKFKIYGSGWQGLPRFAAFASAWPTGSVPANQCLNDANLVVYLDNESNYRQVVFNALCAGRPVLVKRLRDDRLDKHPSVKQALTYLNPAMDLAPQLKSAMQNRQTLQARALEARDYLAKNYTFSHLLERLPLASPSS